MKSVKLKKLIFAFLGFLMSGFLLNSNIAIANTSDNVKSEEVITPLSEGFNLADLIEEVTPTVVSIVPKIKQQYGNSEHISTAIGSGFFVTPTRIITNNHVVEGSFEIEVILSDGRKSLAKVINTDPNKDIAVIELTDPNVKATKISKLGTSYNINPGEWVFSIGSPLGVVLNGTANIGVVSGAPRVNSSYGHYTEYIQSDVSINVGNSGGPLFNFKGEVVGMNTADILVDGYEGITLSISIDEIKRNYERLSNAPVIFGISGVSVNKKYVEGLESTGVFVTSVLKESMAEKIGLKTGDVILEINGIQINSVDKIKGIKNKFKDDLIVKVVRNNSILELKSNVK